MNELDATDTRAAREFLRAGLAEVRIRPWIQGATRRECDGGVCAMGALFAAQVTARRRGHAVSGDCLLDAHNRLESAARDLAGDGVSVADFNDNHAETKADIIALYEKAIADSQIAPSDKGETSQ